MGNTISEPSGMLFSLLEAALLLLQVEKESRLIDMFISVAGVIPFYSDISWSRDILRGLY